MPVAHFAGMPKSTCSLSFLTHPPIPLSCMAYVLKCENGDGTLNSKLIMLEAHFIFFHLNMNHSAGDFLCFFFFFFVKVCSLFLSLSFSFICLPLGKCFFDCLHHFFCGNKRLLFYQKKKPHWNDHLEQEERRKAFWRKIIPFPYFC